MRKRCGFTLIELLVVISIIALLLSIMMPSLKKAKLAAKRVICLHNLQNLGFAWTMYAEDNNGILCQTKTGGEYSWVRPMTWSTPMLQRITSVEGGTLWPYMENIKTYCCPSTKREEVVAYTIFCKMNDVVHGGEKNLRRILRPGTRSVFIDEGVLSPDCFSLVNNAESWWDCPPVRHDNGATLSFADTHAEFWKWKDERTIELGLAYDADPFTNYPRTHPGSEDLWKLQKAVWGFVTWDLDD